MSWKTQHLDLGKVAERSTHYLTYQWDGEIPESFAIIKMETSCGCTTPFFNKDLGILKATFKAGKVPKHLTTVGEVTTTKKIKLTTNSMHDNYELSFTATIRK